MDNKLLAHLSFRLTSQHEVIATEALTYILQQSDICRRAVEHLASATGCDLPEISSYQSEIAGENLERPDIVGFTAEGVETLIIEGKFDAGLTDNQPNNYLSRLPTDTDGLLVFVVPELRVESLWNAVSARASDNYQMSNQRTLPDGAKCVDVSANQKLMMTSWDKLLNALLQPAQRASAPVIGDILQLISLCDRIEGETFKPFGLEELTSTYIARRNRDFCNIVDTVTQRLLDTGRVSTRGMRATPQIDGYVRYVRFGGDDSEIGGSIKLDYSAWTEHEVSPIWLETWAEANADLRSIFKDVALADGVDVFNTKSTTLLPLDIWPGQELSEIVDAAEARISRVLDRVSALPSRSN